MKYTEIETVDGYWSQFSKILLREAINSGTAEKAQKSQILP